MPLDAEAAHDIERMLAAAQRDAGLIYICNPNNPTGTPHPARADRQGDRTQARAQRGAGRRGVYPFFRRTQRRRPGPVQRQDVLVLRTFSKLYGMAGARLGLAIGHPQLLARLERFGGYNVVALADRPRRAGKPA
ncbi:aminotransferase [Pseudomonas aeruginosa]|nr:aminotransferase [Pseudomonas aeruginosa]